MPKPIAVLMTRESQSLRQPHAAIVRLMLEDRTRAHTAADVLDAVREMVPRWRVTGDLPMSQRIAITGALEELLETSVLVELSDGIDSYFAMLPEIAPWDEREASNAAGDRARDAREHHGREA